MSFADRLNQILDKHHYPPKGQGRQVALAKAFNLSQKGVRKWLEGEGAPRTSRLIEIAKKFNVSVEWLISGKGDMVTTNNQEKETYDELNSKKLIQIRWVPIINWENVNKTSIKNLTKDQIIDIMPVPFNKTSESSYALKVKGESMISPHFAERSFLPDQLIVVDPKIMPKNGDYIIAKLNEQSPVSLKQFIIEDGILYLKPLNPRYPINQIKENTQIIGVVTLTFDYTI